MSCAGLPTLPMFGAPAERRDAAANRARILAVARRLLCEEGVAATSIDRIAAEAGVGKGTIFRRFGDRAGLTAALLDEQMSLFQDAFLSGPPPLGPGAHPAERLEAFVDALLVIMDEHFDVAMAAERSATVPTGAIAGPLCLHVRGLIAELDPDLDGDMISSLLLGALSPPVIARLRARGADLAAQQSSARALLRGLTRR